MARWIEFDGGRWRVAQLARAYALSPATLSHRLERFGETATGIQRALTTGIMTRSQAGRAGATRSPWRYPGGD